MAAGKKPRQRLTDGPAKVLDSDAATGGEKGEPAAASEQQREDIGQPFPIVGIGASAGGLEAFSQLIGVMPADTGMAFVLVQHLDPTHASMLSEIVSKKTAIPVTEARDRMPVEPDHIYVISPGSNMSLRGGVLQLSPRKETAGQFRPIDHFFRSLAHEQGHKAIGVILSGGATDGTLGMKEVKGGGGITFAQDATAQHDSMPRSAIAAGWVDHVLPPNEIAREIARISRHPYMAPREPQPDAAGEQAMQKVLEVVRTATGVDFTNYKRNTLHRRITRRLVLRKLGGLKEYARVLQSTPAEVAALYQDILISVTSFFRNPEAFDALKTHVFPELLKGRARHEPIRVWVLGCSTGEEAYSLAIALTEFCEQRNQKPELQIFATDLNDAGIQRARAGVYSKDIAADVSPQRLQRFFGEVDGSYRVHKAIRDMCVFARHNALTDPPFSRVDLISCRNLLIYLEPVLQQRLIPVMHYALNPNGFLWLGTSETIGAYRDLFEVADTKQKVYSRKAGPPQGAKIATAAKRPETKGRVAYPAGPFREVGTGADTQKEADRLLLARFAPPAVLVNADLDIVQFRGDTGHYLTPAPGKASLNLLKMLREGLLVSVRAAVSRARREGTAAREEGLRVKSNGGYRRIDIEVIPVKANAEAVSFLVLFEDAQAAAGRAAEAPNEQAVAAPDDVLGDEEATRLKQELAATREYLQAVIEQQEAANEELQSANEEVQSANEELQSINEELETSKEEIQSSNEELATVNDELQVRITELHQTNSDLVNLLGSVEMAIVMLGPDLRIRRFTPAAEKLLNLKSSDVGRSFGHIRADIQGASLEHLVVEAIDTAAPLEKEVQDSQGRWYSLRMRPYRTLDHKIDGAVLLLVDIDALKRYEHALLREADLLDQAYEPILIWELDGGITYWNRAAEELYGYSRDDALGRRPYELLRTAPAPEAFRNALVRDGNWSGEITHVRRDGGRILVDSRMSLVRTLDGRADVIETTQPIAERKRVEQGLRDRADELVLADRRKNEFLAVLSHELRNPLAPMNNALHIVKEPAAAHDVRDEAVEMLERQMRRLTHLVDDLLDVSRIEHGKIALRRVPVELGWLLTRVADDNRDMIAAREQRLELQLPRAPVYVSADPTRLTQVLGNLLSNASKYSAVGSPIYLTGESVRLGDDGTQQAVITVRDHGIGIEAAILPHVFELFAQEDRAITRDTGGLGIGLTLAKTLVELHDGTIEAKSEGRNRGSEFVVRLAVLPDVPPFLEPEEPAAEKLPHALAAHRVLVVDDNTDAADSLTEVLRLAGHDAQAVYDANAALERRDSFRPDVVILDLALPGIDGFDLGRRFRAQDDGAVLTMIALSGYGQDDDRRQSHEAGFDHHMTKPADIALLLRLITQEPPDRQSRPGERDPAVEASGATTPT